MKLAEQRDSTLKQLNIIVKVLSKDEIVPDILIFLERCLLRLVCHKG